MPGSVQLSVVIPAYNERENMGELIPALFHYLESRGIRGEVVVADDESPDGTGERVKELSRAFPSLKLVTPPQKKGIGFALATGYDACQGEWILSLDADLDVQPAVLDRMISMMREGYDIVVASKYFTQTKLIRNSFKEKFQTVVSWGGAFYMRTLTRSPVHDFSMNFRMLNRRVWKSISPQDPQNFFLAECIFQAHQKGFRIGEVPFVFNPRKYGESKTQLWSQTSTFITKTWAYRFWSKPRNGTEF